MSSPYPTLGQDSFLSAMDLISLSQFPYLKMSNECVLSVCLSVCMLMGLTTLG